MHTIPPLPCGLCLGLKHHQERVPSLFPGTSRTRCPVSLCLENVLGFLIDAKFAHDGICGKCFPPSPVGRETLSLLARLGALCQRSLALGKRDSPEQGTGSARATPAGPAQEDTSHRPREPLTLPSQGLPNEVQGLSG